MACTIQESNLLLVLLQHAAQLSTKHGEFLLEPLNVHIQLNARVAQKKPEIVCHKRENTYESTSLPPVHLQDTGVHAIVNHR
jgi:hypothetical protein